MAAFKTLPLNNRYLLLFNTIFTLAAMFIRFQGESEGGNQSTPFPLIATLRIFWEKAGKCRGFFVNF